MSDKLLDVLPFRRLLVGACSSIGITSLPDLLVWFRAVLPEIEITVVLTRNASRIIPASTFAALTRRPAFCRWEDAESGTVPHIELTDGSDLFVVMPATANVLGKAAHGIADDLLTSCILAATCPIVFVPAMNARMWQKPVVQRNVARLREDGAFVIDPVEGLQTATGKTAVGSMPPVRDILKAFVQVAQSVRAAQSARMDEQ